MKVWVVTWEPYHENSSVIGVFDSRTAARDFAIERDNKERPSWESDDNCAIYECEMGGSEVNLVCGPFSSAPVEYAAELDESIAGS